MIEYHEQMFPIGSKPIRLTTTLSREDALELTKEHGHVYQLGRVTWDEDGTAVVEFVPGNGMIRYAIADELDPRVVGDSAKVITAKKDEAAE